MTLGMPSATCTKLSTVIKLNKEPETTIPTEPQADINTLLAAVLSSRISIQCQSCPQCRHCFDKGVLASRPQFGQLLMKTLSLCSFKILLADILLNSS